MDISVITTHFPLNPKVTGILRTPRLQVRRGHALYHWRILGSDYTIVHSGTAPTREAAHRACVEAFLTTPGESLR